VNSDIRVSTNAPRHRKIKRLSAKLRGFIDARAVALGLAVELWCNVAVERPGEPVFDSVDDLELSVDWVERGGAAGALAAALIDAGLIDTRTDGRLEVHDWEENNEFAKGAPQRSLKGRANAHKQHCQGANGTGCDKSYCPNFAGAPAEVHEQSAEPVAEQAATSTEQAAQPLAEPNGASGSTPSRLPLPLPLPLVSHVEEKKKGDRVLSSSQRDVKRVIDAFPKDYPFPLPTPSRAGSWIHGKNGSPHLGVEAVIAIIEIHSSKNVNYIEQCITTAALEPTGGTARKRTKQDRGVKHDYSEFPDRPTDQPKEP